MISVDARKVARVMGMAAMPVTGMCLRNRYTGENPYGIENESGYFEGIHATDRKRAADFLENMDIIFDDFLA